MGRPGYFSCFLFLTANCCVEASRLEDLRKKLAEADLAAYIVPNSDAHGSEVPAGWDKRREWLSGFTGSWGDALVGRDWAALFTDSRYTIQARKELSEDWQLAKEKVNISNFLVEKLSKGDKVGADPKTISYNHWLNIQKHLNVTGVELVGTEKNFIDELWKDKPQKPTIHIFVHDVKFTGQAYPDKVAKLRGKMAETNSSVLVLTALDDIAWLLNLRGTDSYFTPIFSSFLILTQTEGTLYVREEILNNEVREHLSEPGAVIRLEDEEKFWSDWNQIAKNCTRCFVPFKANYYVYSAVEESKRYTGRSPVVDLRAYKTSTEVEASRKAHITDAIAVCKLFKILEDKIDERNWNESDVSDLLGALRLSQPENRGRSFPDIVASGANAALPHYQPKPSSAASVNRSAVLLIDSGGQYFGGTTDITRVLHLGKPRLMEVDVYSRLLRGVARLGSTVFPEGTVARDLDSILRAPLYQVGLNYGHGSTHGTGVFLHVHEDFNGTYYENFIGSQEPGYYEEDDFGMRLENLVVVRPANTMYTNKTGKPFLKFSPLTLVPYERKLINANLFDDSELEWVNNYHKEVLDKVGAEVQKRDDQSLYQWLVEKTALIVKR